MTILPNSALLALQALALRQVNMYREIRQTNLSEFHSTVWEELPKVSTK